MSLRWFIQGCKCLFWYVRKVNSRFVLQLWHVVCIIIVCKNVTSALFIVQWLSLVLLLFTKFAFCCCIYYSYSYMHAVCQADASLACRIWNQNDLSTALHQIHFEWRHRLWCECEATWLFLNWIRHHRPVWIVEFKAKFWSQPCV